MAPNSRMLRMIIITENSGYDNGFCVLWDQR